jgi:hypothetical protein
MEYFIKDIVIIKLIESQIDEGLILRQRHCMNFIAIPISNLNGYPFKKISNIELTLSIL